MDTDRRLAEIRGLIRGDPSLPDFLLRDSWMRGIREAVEDGRIDAHGRRTEDPEQHEVKPTTAAGAIRPRYRPACGRCSCWRRTPDQRHSGP